MVSYSYSELRKMNHKLLIVVGIGLVIYVQVCFSAFASEFIQELKPETKVRTFLGSEASIMADADEIEVFKLGNYGKQKQNFEGFLILGKSRKLLPKEILSIKKIFCSDITYDFDEWQKNCTFTPSLGLEFKKGNRKLRLLICYDCYVLRFVGGGIVREEDFDSSKKRIIKIYLDFFSVK